MKMTALIVTALFLLIINPVLCWAFGWLFGWFLKLFIGDTFIYNLNLLLGTNLSVDFIPSFCGVLGVIGHFFKGSAYTPKLEE